MVQAKCIEKHKDTNGKIQEYIIVDWSGQQCKFNADELKAAIKNNQINVINLKLTRDNRLIDKAIKTLNNKNSTVISKVQKDNNDILDKPSMSSTQILNRIKETHRSFRGGTVLRRRTFRRIPVRELCRRIQHTQLYPCPHSVPCRSERNKHIRYRPHSPESDIH